MSGQGPGIAGKRVLVLGRSPAVLETVMQELADLGLHVEGSIEPERAPELFDARSFDLIAFGGGLHGPVAGGLKERFRRRTPQARFLDTFAPRAVREIAAALAEAEKKPAIDLDAYCARIGYAGPLGPTLATLRALIEHHPAAIPFEAIDVLLGRGVDLAPAALDAKLIRARRGGYCFEQNGLLRRALVAIGFEVEILLGRVLWRAPPGAAPRPRTHMALQVTIEGTPWLADVGFGSSVPTAPLRIDTAEPQPTGHEAFRVVAFGSGLQVQTRLEERWAPLYQLAPEPQEEVDLEPANWFTSTHPASPFRSALIVTRVTREARSTLLNGQLTVRRPGVLVERRQLDAGGIEEALGEVFGLAVEPEWRPVIERAAAAG